jgi:amino acid transporter
MTINKQRTTLMTFRAEQPRTAYIASSVPGLKADCLSYVEVLAQSVSVIAPSTVPAAVLGLIFAAAGNGTWLSFLIGMLGLVLVSYNINQFARRSASAGSLYSYIVKGLGSRAGVLGGCALLFGYTLTGMSTLCGFVLTVNALLGPLGWAVSSLLLSAVAVLVAFGLAARDVQLSAKAMLTFEGAAIVAVLALGIAVWKHTGFQIDTQQFTLVGTTPGGVLTGMVLVVFAFSGFESSTALGEEAKDPLRAIPRSVVQSVIVSGMVFVFMAYVVILGFRGLNADLGKSEAPLLALSNELGLKWLGASISIGVVLSFFSCTLASINATARIIFAMARHGLVPKVLGLAHPRNETPYVAIGFAAVLTFLATSALSLFGVSNFDGQGYFGTLCTFGFLTVYVLISLAAPAYLYRIGELTKSSIVVAALAVGFMIIPFLGTIGVPGSALFPPPDYPNNLLVWLFLAFMIVSATWLFTLQRLRPDTIDHVFDANGGLKSGQGDGAL